MAPRDSFFSRLFARPRAAWKRLRSISLSPWLTRLIWVVIAVAVPAAIWALIYIPSWQVGRVLSEGASARAVFELENAARRTMAQIVLGVFGLLALFVTWRRARAAEKAVQVAERGQQTERFTKAIEQLGATDDRGQPRLEVRLGGIYALERLARDSEYLDYWTIVEVLTAYVRRNSSYTAEIDADPTSDGYENLRIDIQAVMTVLGRRDKVDKEGGVLNLSATDLRGADLRHASLQRAILEFSRLDGANLKLANLEETVLSNASLNNADLTKARLVGTYLACAGLQGAQLGRAVLDGADLTEAKMCGARLFEARLDQAIMVKADFSRACLARARMEEAFMEEACFEQADLRSANLKQAWMPNATLQGANLERATLAGAHLIGVDFREAQLAGADLSSTEVTPKGLASAHGDASTRLPDGIAPPDNWTR